MQVLLFGISINNHKITSNGVEWFSENLLYRDHEEIGNDCQKSTFPELKIVTQNLK